LDGLAALDSDDRFGIFADKEQNSSVATRPAKKRSSVTYIEEQEATEAAKIALRLRKFTSAEQLANKFNTEEQLANFTPETSEV
jgi:hypothetical protein